MPRVRLTRPHTHAGKPFTPGEWLEVDAATAAWLLNHDVAAAPEAKPAKTDPKPEPPKEPNP